MSDQAEKMTAAEVVELLRQDEVELDLCEAAADLIERQAAEIERLRYTVEFVRNHPKPVGISEWYGTRQA